jgi:hypothetical protein
MQILSLTSLAPYEYECATKELLNAFGTLRNYSTNGQTQCEHGNSCRGKLHAKALQVQVRVELLKTTSDQAATPPRENQDAAGIRDQNLCKKHCTLDKQPADIQAMECA